MKPILTCHASNHVLHISHVTVDISEKMTDVQILQSTDHQYVDVLLSLRPTVFAANGEPFSFGSMSSPILSTQDDCWSYRIQKHIA